jgi:hypothetical protein
VTSADARSWAVTTLLVSGSGKAARRDRAASGCAQLQPVFGMKGFVAIDDGQTISTPEG